MRKIILFGFLLHAMTGKSQELFTMTEPASNIAARSISIRVDNLIMDETYSSKINYHLVPELALGISKEWMVRASTFFSNRTGKFRNEGGGIYARYRFFSSDAMQEHFRIAAFALLSNNNSDIHQEEISMYGHNTGFEVGMVSTKLLHKIALSAAASFVKAFDNGNNNKFIYGLNNGNAINFSFSFGKLMLPKVYTGYRQTNLNLMLETLSQLNTRSGKYYIDIAPTIQFIFRSQSRIDISYRKQISSSLLRTAPNGFFIRIEHNLFNVF
jgi:hypothetical protein